MRLSFVKTKNWSRFQEGLRGLNERGAEECRLIVVDGKPGLGKTTILTRWAVQQDCLYLRAKAKWDAYWMLGELLAECNVPAPYGSNKRFEAALSALGVRAQQADLGERQFAVVIDEADHVAKRPMMIETIRDLVDVSAVPFILVGMGTIRDQLKRYPQATSRVSRYVRFEPADVEDVSLFLAENCSAKIAPDLVAFVHRVTGGFNREICEAIRTLEQADRRCADVDPDVGLSCANMAGQLLINDRATGAPIHVRSAV